MVIVLKQAASRADVDAVHTVLDSYGVGIHYTLLDGKVVFSIDRGEQDVDADALRALNAVEHVAYISKPYRLASREFKAESSVVHIGDVAIGNGEAVVIGGPCAVESETQILEAAQIVRENGGRILRGGAFKPRTSPYTFQGLGEDGLKLLALARETTGLKVVTEVMDAADVDLVARYADMLQIGSRNMKNYRLLKAAGESGKPVLLKRGMASLLDELLSSAEYVLAEGNSQVILCERGIRTFSDFSRNTLDLNIVPAIKKISHLPVIVDPSHGTGMRYMIEPMSLAALACGADGLMVEVHPRPDESKSDADQAIGREQFAAMMHKVRDFIEWQKAHADAVC